MTMSVDAVPLATAASIWPWIRAAEAFKPFTSFMSPIATGIFSRSIHEAILAGAAGVVSVAGAAGVVSVAGAAGVVGVVGAPGTAVASNRVVRRIRQDVLDAGQAELALHVSPA